MHEELQSPILSDLRDEVRDAKLQGLVLGFQTGTAAALCLLVVSS